LVDVIGVLSGKGGVGKTTIVANTATVLSHEFGKKIVVIDSNVSTSDIGLHFGIYEDPPVTLSDVLQNDIPLAQALYIHPMTGVRIIPTSLPMRGKISSEKLKKLTQKIKNMDYGFVLMDCAPGMGNEVVTAAKVLDKAIIVTTPDIPAVTNALKMIEVLNRMKKNVMGVILNRVKGTKYELSQEEVESMCDSSVIGTIPEDGNVPESVSKGIPLVVYKRNSKAAIALERFAAKLIGKDYRQPTIWDNIESIISKFANLSNFLGNVRFNGETGKTYKTNRTGSRLRTDSKLIRTDELDGRIRTQREELANIDALKDEIKKEVKEDVKKELVKRLRDRLKEERGKEGYEAEGR
jgi:septum site-determining protein MinD